jgi:acetylornithine/succinyldiaminopimelate/putrescine aminotransferase
MERWSARNLTQRRKGAKTQKEEKSKTLKLLQEYESRNVTFMESDRSWPIVWERASGMFVWDSKGKKYLDLTAAFGVAAAGHANAKVVRAGQAQMKKLLHAMGDVHPHPLKGELVRKLSEITFERWTSGRVTGRTILGNSGFEAVEAAFKTAILATNRSGVITFEGGYHGLGYGALNATHRRYFRKPFESQLGNFGKAAPWPDVEAVGKVAGLGGYGAVLVEPIQARGGIRVPPRDFLPKLRKVCDEFEMLLILDEIYTGFGRTGEMFACEHSRTIPDLICLGKALTGGFPLSACVGRADIMDLAWPPSHGEALHTSTFLGHPVGCAMALAQISEVKKLVRVAAERGEFLYRVLDAEGLRPHGMGLMFGVDVEDARVAMGAIKRLLKRGFIFLPEGDESNVIGFTPPLIISEKQIRDSVQALVEEL